MTRSTDENVAEKSSRLELALRCRTGPSPWADASVPMLAVDQRLDLRHDLYAERGTYICSVVDGDCPMGPETEGVIRVLVAVPERQLGDFAAGHRLALLKADIALADAVVLKAHAP